MVPSPTPHGAGVVSPERSDLGLEGIPGYRDSVERASYLGN